jgi:hypothetical protein
MSEVFTPVDHKKIITTILQDWDSLGLPPIDKKSLEFKLLPFRKTGQHSLVNYMIISNKRPAIVIKLPRFKEGFLAFTSINNEAKMLDLLEQKTLLSGHFPKMLKSLNIENIPVLLTIAYQGDMLHQLLDNEEDLSHLGGLLSGAADLLPLFPNPKKDQRGVVDDSFIHKYIKEPLKIIHNLYPREAKPIGDFVDNFLKDRVFHNAKYPVVLMHQEFNPWNILKEDNGNLLIFDWEDAVEDGLPLLDLYNYFTICYRILIIGETKHAQARSRENKQRRIDILLEKYSEHSSKYCKALNIPAELLDLFYMVFAINSIVFFAGEKRKEVEYGRSWLPLLLNTSARDCFIGHIKTASESYLSRI